MKAQSGFRYGPKSLINEDTVVLVLVFLTTGFTLCNYDWTWFVKLLVIRIARRVVLLVIKPLVLKMSKEVALGCGGVLND